MEYPPSSGAMFPVPRISEGFVDAAAAKIGGVRLESVWTPPEGVRIADYLFPSAIAELKILEEEGLLKTSRQEKIARLMSRIADPKQNEIDIDRVPPEISIDFEELLLEPIQGAVRKAAKQLVDTEREAPTTRNCRTLIAVNSGYSSLPADLFERLVLRSCRKDTSRIDFLICMSVHYHQGDFDAFVFFKRTSHSVRNKAMWLEAEAFMDAATAHFGKAMSEMMRDQVKPELWATHLPPVKDIVFDRRGVRYVRYAPTVPDSRFES